MRWSRKERKPAAIRVVSPGLLSRSEEHTSELQSHVNLVCRLLLDPPPTNTSPLPLPDALPIFSGLGVPPPHLVKKFHEAGLKVMNVSGTVRHARSAEAGGLDAVVAQGTEAGGHTGRVAGLALKIGRAHV